MTTEEPRTTADIMADLLEIVEEGQWVETYEPCPRGCCGEWETKCPECGAQVGEHEPGCKVHHVIQEAQAFVEVERELAA